MSSVFLNSFIIFTFISFQTITKKKQWKYDFHPKHFCSSDKNSCDNNEHQQQVASGADQKEGKKQTIFSVKKLRTNFTVTDAVVCSLWSVVQGQKKLLEKTDAFQQNDLEFFFSLFQVRTVCKSTCGTLTYHGVHGRVHTERWVLRRERSPCRHDHQGVAGASPALCDVLQRGLAAQRRVVWTAGWQEVGRLVSCHHLASVGKDGGGEQTKDVDAWTEARGKTKEPVPPLDHFIIKTEQNDLQPWSKFCPHVGQSGTALTYKYKTLIL